MKHTMTLILGAILGSIAIGKNDDAKKNYMVAQLDEIAPVPCPCGDSRRAFVSPDNKVATVHITTIKTDSQVHYHKKLTETYLVLEGSGHMELDGEKIPIKPMSAILIKPGCRHRAVGKLKIAIFVFPAFDPKDEWFD
jgi:mannose-6-phosphate isomerase-like protein (cupin superfamily)